MTTNSNKTAGMPIDMFSAEYLCDQGIMYAIDHADYHSENWSGRAFEFLKQFILDNSEFMTEDVRLASKGIIEEPPSNRAWGGVVVRAARLGLIRRKGFRNVTNANAHCTPATLWEVVK